MWAIVALLASLGTIAAAITTTGAFWFALPIATVVVFVSNHSRLQQRHHHELGIVDAFDAWIGGAVSAFLGVGIALFLDDSLLGLGTAFLLAFLWRIEWVYPRLDRHAVMAWVETAVRDA